MFNDASGSRSVKIHQYRPISCSVYDIFERAALRRNVLHLTIAGITMKARANDIYARGNEEFLEATNLQTDETVTIRLDQIEAVFDPSDNKLYFPNRS
jgi:transcriptional antiterminator Rof (Rho-off)